MSKWQPLILADSLRIPKKVLELAKTNSIVKDELLNTEVWFNETYQVAKRVKGEDGEGGHLIHLSIKRRDREPCKDWRDFQRIKNQLCGDESEGVELYPAESRVVDAANQYHIWVFTKLKLGIGFSHGLKSGAKEAEELGATQREDEA